MRFPLPALLLILAVGGGRPACAQTDKAPAPPVRFFAVPWLEYGPAWQAGRSNSFWTVRADAARRHLGGGLAVEVMPSPNVGIGLGAGVVGLGGEYTATYRVNEFFSNQTVSYTVRRALDFTYLRAPLYVRATPHLFGPLRAYGLVGVEPAVLLGVRSDGSTVDDTDHAYSDDFSFIDGALLGGAGAEWWVSENTALLLGLRYRHGVLGVQEDSPPYPGSNFPPGFPLRSYSAPFEARSPTLEVAVKFGPRRPTPAAPPTQAPPTPKPPVLRSL